MAEHDQHACAAHIHCTEEMWRARREGRLSLADSEKHLVEHLLGVCSECAAEFVAASKPRHDYGPVFARLIEEEGGLEAQVEAERAGAERDLEALLELPARERAERIERARKRFGSALLAERLLDRSFEALPQDPKGSLHFAELADLVVTVNPRRGSGHAKIRALAHKGNALRAVGRLADAARRFGVARRLLQDGVPVDGKRPEIVVESTLYAFVDFCEGTYCKAVGDYSMAEELLSRAALLYAVTEERGWLHRVMLTVADLYAGADNYPDAIDTVGRVLVNLSEEEDSTLYWVARFRHADYLARSGVYDGARAELQACAAARGDDAAWRRRMRWLEARIALETGELDHAREELERVRDGFLAEGSGINMAIASFGPRCGLPQAGTDGRGEAAGGGADSDLRGPGRAPGGDGGAVAVPGGRTTGEPDAARVHEAAALPRGSAPQPGAGLRASVLTVLRASVLLRERVEAELVAQAGADDGRLGESPVEGLAAERFVLLVADPEVLTNVAGAGDGGGSSAGATLGRSVVLGSFAGHVNPP